MSIHENYKKIRQEIPEHVAIVLAAKEKNKEEIEKAIDAGATDLGENYVQEAKEIHNSLGEKAKKVRWHMIGHLQKNKINKALEIFDVIQTVDSVKNAREIDKRAASKGKEISVFIEVNIGNEVSKTGIKPEYKLVENLAREISLLKNLKLEGLMTMGPRFGDPEGNRPFFKKIKQIFDKLKTLDLPDTEIKYLSMGMSNSYKVSIEEGSNMIRPGTIIFGERKCDYRRNNNE